MAITLDELLGRNRGDAADEYTSDRFPSYGEFSARRTGGSDVRYADGGEGYAYDFDRRPQSAPRSTEAARDYEASRPYRASREEEYRPIDYAARERRAPSDAGYDAGYDRGYEESARSAYADERGARAYSGGLYEFTRNDAERASGEDLYDRLSATGTASAAKTAGYERAARESYVSEDYAAKYRAEHKTKKKARFGLKAKLIIAAYVIVVAIVGILIIVNAKPLNNGTAAVPSSSVVAVE